VPKNHGIETESEFSLNFLELLLEKGKILYSTVCQAGKVFWWRWPGTNPGRAGQKGISKLKMAMPGT
jgi:hypothetical protein